jgi:hypothetical protein
MVKVISIDESFSSKSGALKTSALTKLNDQFRLKIGLEDSLRDISLLDVNLMAKNWSLSHNTRSKDYTFRASWKPSNTLRVNLTQKAPKGQFFLVPNPCLKITQTGGILGRNNFVSVEHDMMQRCSGATVCLYGGDDEDKKKHKIKVNTLGNSGINASVRSKIFKGTLLHSISASGSTKSQVLTLKSRITSNNKKLKTKLSYSTASNALTLAGNHVMNVDSHKVKASVVVSAPVTRLTSPSVQVGMNFQI